MKKISFLLLAAPLHLLAATPAQIGELTSLRSKANESIHAYIAARDGRNQEADKIKGLRSQQKQYESELTTLRKRVSEASDHPDVPREKVVALIDSRDLTATRLEHKKKQIDELDARRGQLESEMSRHKELALNSKKTLDSRIRTAIDADLQQTLAREFPSRVVKGTHKMVCGDLPAKSDKCGREAKRELDNKLISEGSAAYVQSFTEMKNNQITRDEASSSVQASIDRRKYLVDKLELVEDQAAWRLEMEATVTPAFSPQIKESIKSTLHSQVISAIGGEPDYALLNSAQTLSADEQKRQRIVELLQASEEARTAKQHHQLAALSNDLLELDPNDVDGLSNLAWANVGMDRMHDAIKIADRAISRDANFGRAYLVRATALMKTGRDNEAKRDLNRACNLGVSAACEVRKQRP